MGFLRMTTSNRVDIVHRVFELSTYQLQIRCFCFHAFFLTPLAFFLTPLVFLGCLRVCHTVSRIVQQTVTCRIACLGRQNCNTVSGLAPRLKLNASCLLTPERYA